MSAEKKTRIRDRRKAGWFRIDDEIIEVYGPVIGVHGIAVYAALAKYANRDQESHPGLRRLCKELKIGRKKLLDTLELLKENGLIDIEPGDRVNVNVYTLLDIPKKPKGGSNENQEVVLDRTRGGSDENRGWFQPEPGGGSDENRNQTQYEPDPYNQKREDNVTPLGNTTRRCVSLLRKTKGWKKDPAETSEIVDKLRAKYPDADPVSCCEEFEFNLNHGSEQVKNHPNKLMQYFRVAHERGRRSAQGAVSSTAGYRTF